MKATRRALLAGSMAAIVGRQSLAQTSCYDPAGLCMPAMPGGDPNKPNLAGAPSLDLNFINGSALDSRVTFTRASGASYFDATGILQTAASNTPRIDYGPAGGATPLGLLIEEQRTNSIRNPRAEGAAAGTPGTLPTNWGIASTAGLTTSVVGTGTESGIPYIDFRFSGTTNSTSFLVFGEASAIIAATTGQSWTHSVYYRLVAGSLANVTGIAAGINEANAGGSQVAFGTATAPTVTSAGLATQRASYTRVLSDATTAWTRPYFNFLVANAAAVDFTIRIGAPQLELGAFATSLILPAIGSPAATTRAADAATMPVGSWFNAAAGTLSDDIMLPQMVSSISDLPSLASSVPATDYIGNREASGGVSTLVFAASALKGSSGLAGTVSANSPFKTAFTYNVNALAVTGCLNGNAIATIVPTAFPSPITQLVFGFVRAGNTNGYVRRVRYWPRVLGSTELQGVTT